MQDEIDPPRFSMFESNAERHLASFADEVETGLSGKPKSLPCRFLYDAKGSLLFEEICDLPEYYLTRAERQILEQHSDSIAKRFDGPPVLVELGSGSSAKTRLLIEAFLQTHRRLRYVPIDISPSILETSARELLSRYDALEVRAVASEYEEGLRQLRRENGHAKVIAWLGSTIGNLDRDQALAFLRQVRDAMAPPDRMLLGVDLRKASAVLEPAYDDGRGITARFSLNLLERINRELGGNFDVAAFRHSAVYHEEQGRVAIHVVSRKRQRVVVEELELEVEFDTGEGIHIEDSFKYSLGEIQALTKAAGLSLEDTWLDDGGRFSLSFLAPA
jgi:L-histidine N-alpha-methyltransferase